MKTTANEEQVGKYFKAADGSIWQMISYCKHPTATFEKLGTTERLGGSVYSPNVNGFDELPEALQSLTEQLHLQIPKKR